MKDFDLKGYLAENKLLKEGIEGIPQYYVEYTTLDGETAKSGLMSKREAIYKERDLVNSGIKKSSVYKIQKNIDLNGNPYEINYKLDKEIEYRTDEDGKPINEDLFNLRKYLAENKLIKEGDITEKIPGLFEFMKFLTVMKSQLQKSIDDEEFIIYNEAHQNLSDAIDHWVDEVMVIERKYPS